MLRVNKAGLIVEEITERLGKSPDFICKKIEAAEDFSLYCIYLHRS